MTTLQHPVRLYREAGDVTDCLRADLALVSQPWPADGKVSRREAAEISDEQAE